MNWLIVRIKALRITHHVVTNILLLGILLVLARISWRMPPTLGDLRKELDGGGNFEGFKESIPYVNVFDAVRVEVDAPLEVEIDDLPLRVHVDNEPVDVRIER